MSGSILIKNGLLVTMDENKRIFRGNLFIEDGVLREVGTQRTYADQVIQADGRIVMPGFIQTHIHLCQVLFRGLADDVDVVDWLKQRIWPFESAHDEQSIHASADLGIAELIAGGTTTALSMETTRHTDGVFSSAMENGFRLIAGNAMMDTTEPGTEMQGLSTEESMAESKRLYRQWHGQGGGTIQYAVMPRGARNCSPRLVEMARRFAEENGLLFHTHVSENGPLSARLVRETGMSDMELLESQQVANERLVIAHGIWLSDHDREIVRRRGVKIAHCPSANMKLASGFCKAPEMAAEGICISLGADGAPCNNNLDMLNEMRLASLIHKPRCGPKSMNAYQILEMATINGARCLGMDDKIGSLTPGKLADVILLDRNGLHSSPDQGVPVDSQIVYSLRSSDVDTTIIGGKVLYLHKQFTNIDMNKVLATAQKQARRALESVQFGKSLLANLPY